jgi:uncharacterized membrane protein
MFPIWIIYAIINPGLQAIVNFTDKFILSSKIKDYRGFFVYGSIVAFFIGIALWVIAGFPVLNSRDALLTVLTGVFSIWGSILYFRALQKENTSKIVFLFGMIPVIVLFLSTVFLKESLSVRQFMGFLLILIPSLIISNDNKLIFKFNESFVLILIADILWAFGSIFFKFVSTQNSYMSLIGYETLGWPIGGAIVFLLSSQVRKSFISTTRTMNLSTIGIVFANEGVFVVAKMAGFLAISLGPVALVSVIGGTQMFFAILYGWILTTLSPKIFKEDITKKGLMKKVFWGLVMISGIFLVT